MEQQILEKILRITSYLIKKVVVLIRSLYKFFSFPFRLFARIWRFTFGRFQYSGPPWITFLSGKIKPRVLSGLEKFQSFKKEKPLLFARVAVLSLASLILFLAYFTYAQFRTTPPVVSVSIKVPLPPDFEAGTAPDSLLLEFDRSVAPLENIGKTIASGIELDPDFKGTWQWQNDRTLVFRPAAHWPVGEDFKIHLNKSITSKTYILEDYDFTFSTSPLVATIESLRYHIDYKNPSIKQAVGEIHFNYPIKAEDFSKYISIEQKKEGLSLTATSYDFDLDFNDTSTIAYVRSRTIPIPDKDSHVTLTVDSGIVSSLGGPGLNNPIAQDLLIPGMNSYFSIVSGDMQVVRNKDYAMEQVLTLETKGEAKDESLLKGMEIYLLPKDRPALAGMEPHKNHIWDVSEIGPEILSKSRKISAQLIPGERDYATLHNYRFSANTDRYLYVHIKKGIRNFAGYVLAEDYENLILVKPFPRLVNILHEGSLLSLRGEKKLTVMSNNVRTVKIEIARVRPEQVANLVSQTGGDFQNPYFRNYNFNVENLSEQFSEIRDMGPGDTSRPGSVKYTAVDFSRYLSRNGIHSGLFFLTVSGYNKAPERKNNGEVSVSGSSVVSDSRFVLVSDLGFLIKQSATGNHDIFVQSVKYGSPVGGVHVEVLGKNGLPVASTTTDDQGRASFPSLADFKREKEPTAFVLKKGTDISFMPYERYDRRLNLSSFDTGGVYSSQTPDKLTAHLFTERGLYRPGDTFHTGIIVKSSDWSKNLAGLPLELSVQDARSLEIHREVIRLPRSGFSEFEYKTDPAAPTGYYQVRLYTIKDNRRDNLLGSTSLRVDEFKPDKMKITARFEKESIPGWLSPDMIKANVHLRYLFGADAKDHRISANITLNPGTFTFAGFKDYSFYDSGKSNNTYTENLSELKTDDTGHAQFDIDLKRFEKGTYRLTFYAEGYEKESGRAVATSKTVMVSPFTYLVGFKSNGNLSFINRGTKRAVNIIAISSELKKINVKKLTARIVEKKHITALLKSDDGTFQYKSIEKVVQVEEKPLNISSTGNDYILPTENPGSFSLEILDEKKNVLNRIDFTVAGKSNLAGRIEKDSELQVRLNKADYAPGEEIQISIIAPYTGSGLITVERDRVYSYKWFRTNSTSSVESIRVPDNLEGNAYINVSFVRSSDSEDIYSSPLSYGVKPFSISKERRNNKITLNTPKTARPGKPFRIQYSTKRNGKIVIFAVDEGILQVANYRTPDPLGFFFQKKALETITTQILDLILPEYSIVRRLSGFGGGDGSMGGQNLNPFKSRRQPPVVFWSGIIDSGPETRTVSYDVPDYFNGTLRVMAVSVADDSVGSADTRSFIKDYFIINPNVPAFVAPGDTVNISIGVSNNVKGSGKDAKVTIDFKTKGDVTIVGNGKRSVNIPEGEERVEVFTVKSGKEPGDADFTVIASSGKFSSTITSGMSIRPVVPFIMDIKRGILSKDKIEVPLDRKMFSQFRKVEASVSPLPLGLSRGFIDYLEEYPHACSEQLVSSVFPSLVLKDHPELGKASNKMESRLSDVVRILRVRQNQRGAFGFWAANSHVSDFQSVYIMHFLLEAKERGQAIPVDMQNRGISYLKELGNRKTVDLVSSRTRAYAIYILTRHGIVTSRMLASLKKDLGSVKGWKEDVTALYMASAYSLMQQNKEAFLLLVTDSFPDTVTADYDNFYDTRMRNAQYLYLASRHFPAKLKRIPSEKTKLMLESLTEDSFNTISASYTILALEAYTSAIDKPDKMDMSIAEILENGKSKEVQIDSGLFPSSPLSTMAEAVKIQNNDRMPLFYQVIQGGFDKNLPESKIENGVEIFREYRSLSGSETNEAGAGEVIEVVMKIRALKSSQHNMAVVDLLPGGFEPVFESVRENQKGASPWNVDFANVREDRVILYGNISTDAREFRYRIRAVNPGEYTIPPAFTESMYDSNVRGISPAGNTFTIKRKD